MKVLLFGASIGGQNFIKNHKDDYEILAVIDNDPNKQGKLLENIEIIPPNKIHKYSYDKIIVTSMFVTSISKQLKELGVPPEKVEYASKNSMKMDMFPFENPEILKKTNKIIIEISKILKDIPHYYTFGTLLGIVRDGRLIPWDDDIDVAIFAKDFEKVKNELVKSVEKFEALFDVKIILRMYSNGNPASINIECFERGKKLFIINFDCMYVVNDMVEQELNITPYKFFDGYDEYPFNGFNIRIPKNYEEYLEYTYGDWKIIKKNTSFADNTLTFREPKFRCTVEVVYESKS